MDAAAYRSLAVALAVAGAIAAPPASGATGGVTAPVSGTGGGATTPAGGTRPAAVPTPSVPTRVRGKRPTLTAFSVSAKRFYAYGAPLRVSFQIDGPARPVPVSLRVLKGGTLVRTVALGTLATGAPHTYALAPDTALPEGKLELRIAVPRLRRGAQASRAEEVGFYGHRFPLTGAFTYGDPFGAARTGHTHAGQDLLAAQGTPIVAPRGGTVTQAAYQPAAAGYYVVVSGAGESLDYAFMHMAAGTTRVQVGQTVRTGQRLGDVGSTGASTGPHLHFEVWQGPWQDGGRALDPLPYLESWR